MKNNVINNKDVINGQIFSFSHCLILTIPTWELRLLIFYKLKFEFSSLIQSE